MAERTYLIRLTYVITLHRLWRKPFRVEVKLRLRSTFCRKKQPLLACLSYFDTSIVFDCFLFWYALSSFLSWVFKTWLVHRIYFWFLQINLRSFSSIYLFLLLLVLKKEKFILLLNVSVTISEGNIHYKIIDCLRYLETNVTISKFLNICMCTLYIRYTYTYVCRLPVCSFPATTSSLCYFFLVIVTDK